MHNRHWLTRLSQILSNIGGVVLVIASIVAFTNVISRKFLGHPFSWSDELVGFLSVWVVYLPLALMEESNGHLRITVLYDLASPRIRWWMDRLQDVLIIGLLVAMAYIGIGLVQMNLELNVTSPTLHLPLGVLYAVVPVSFALAALSRLLGFGMSFFAREGEGGK